jgi:hypothetical protein
MESEALIRSLSKDLQPVSRHALSRLISGGLAVGILLSLAAVAATLGFRADIAQALREPGFWIKWVYSASIALIAIWATMRLARPNAFPPWLWLLAAPITVLGLLGIIELSAAPSSEWMSMWLGKTAARCPFLVFGLSLPIFGALLLSLRRLAPTRLRVAGGMAGLAAGACAAMVYCLHCPESSTIFVFSWYTLGMLLSTATGILTGPTLLRW